MVLFAGPGAETLAAEVQAVLRVPTSTVLDRREFQHLLGPRCLGVVCLASVTQNDLSWLSGIAVLRSECAVIFVTGMTKRTGQLLAEFHRRLPGLVWSDEVVHRLPSMLSELIERDSVRGVLESFVAEIDPPPVLGLALQKLIESVPPITSVRALAECVGVSRGTLDRYWAAIADRHLTLKELIDWVLITRAAEMSERSVTGIAFGLRIHRRTLERMVERRLGVSMSAFRRIGPMALAQSFAQRLQESVR